MLSLMNKYQLLEVIQQREIPMPLKTDNKSLIQAIKNHKLRQLGLGLSFEEQQKRNELIDEKNCKEKPGFASVIEIKKYWQANMGKNGNENEVKRKAIDTLNYIKQSLIDTDIKDCNVEVLNVAMASFITDYLREYRL
jgi:hypothetical protein